MDNLLKGKIISWNSKKGFGFIRPNLGTKNVFIHVSDITNRNLQPFVGDIIHYKIGKDKNNKKKAIDAILVSNREKDQNEYLKKKKNSFFSSNILLYILLLSIGLVFLLYINNKLVIYKSDDKSDYSGQVPTTTLLKNSEIYDNRTIETNKLNEVLPNHISKKQNIEKIDYHKSDEDFYRFLESYKVESNVKQPTVTTVYSKSTDNTQKRNFKCDGRQHCNQMTSCKEAKYFINNCPNTKMDGDGDGIPCERQWCGY